MTERIDIVVNLVGGRRVRRGLDDIGGGADDVAGRMALLTRAITAAGIAAAAAFGTLAIRRTIQYQTAIAEVSTLVDTAKFDIEGLNEAILDQSRAFGGLPVEQARAAYQIISAGASTAAEATELLTAANRLAVGGVTDVATAADGLTSILNAYGDAVESAADVSDILFVGVRQGKTTIDELSGSIGRVAPLAANLGIEFEELVSAIAALTKGGISTNEAVTGTRAILAAIAKPSSEAAKAAKALGIEFNTAALESKGLSGFLQDIVDRTGGSEEALALLFGGVEALVPVLALSGQAGEDFTDTLEQMEDRAGSTEEAFDELANSPGFQLQRILSAIQSEAIRAAQSFTQALVPALKFVADNIERIIDVVKALIIVMTVLAGRTAIGAVVSSFLAMTRVMATVITLAGGLSGASIALTGALAAVGRAGVVAFGALLGPIGLVAAAVAGVAVAIGNLRGQLRAITTDADNVVGQIQSATSLGQLDGIEDIINQGTEADLANSSSGASGFVNRLFGTQDDIDTAVVERRDRAIAALEAQRELLRSGGAGQPVTPAGENPLGNLEVDPETTAQLAEVEEILRKLREGDGGGGGGLPKTNEDLERLKQLAEELNPLDRLNQRISDLEVLFATGAISAEQFAAAMRTVNREVSALDNTFSGGIQNGIDRLIERTNDLGKGVSEIVVGAFDKAKEGIVDFAKTGEFNVRDFFGSIFENLLRLATDQLFAQLLSGFGGFGGGGSFLGGLGSFLGFRTGGNMLVGGSGGADSQLVAFKATPGERVTVERPDQVRAAESAAAPDSAEPARCFQFVMHGENNSGGVNYGGGNRWQWRNAADLCAGTRDAGATVTCFRRQVSNGAHWRDAISRCNWATASARE